MILINGRGNKTALIYVSLYPQIRTPLNLFILEKLLLKSQQMLLQRPKLLSVQEIRKYVILRSKWESVTILWKVEKNVCNSQIDTVVFCSKTVFSGHDSTLDLTLTRILCIRLAQNQARKISAQIEGLPCEVLPISKELMVVDACWEEDSKFSGM